LNYDEWSRDVMMIDIKSISEEYFNVKEVEIAGERCYLVTPKSFSVSWTLSTLKFRSSIWNKDGLPVSLSFPKFFNWDEKSNLIPQPEDLSHSHIIEKIDGSALIVSHYKHRLITRTRGTVDATQFDNGYEIEYLKSKYPQAFRTFGGTEDGSSNYSLIYEWYSPSNKIVIDMGDEPDIFLVGAILHHDYSLMTQRELDRLAKVLKVKRPETFQFSSVEEMLKTIESLRGKEGICIYYDHDQHIKKVKGVEYLSLHAFKNNLNVDSMIDLYLEYDMPIYDKFLELISNTFDHECMKASIPFVSKILDAKKEVDAIVSHMARFIEPLRTVPRKDAAEKILSSYGKTNRSSFVFTLLSGRSLTKDNYRKLFHQCVGQ